MTNPEDKQAFYPEHRSSPLNVITLLSGTILIGLFALLWFISPEFSLEIPLMERPVLVLVSILVIAGAVYLLALRNTLNTPLSRSYLLWIIVVGIAMRVFMIVSVPILEDDYFRYFWDGAVTVSGTNPYSYSPENVLGNNGVPEKLTELASESGGIIENINNPGVRTIYPPIAQAAFAFSYLLDPFNLITWKIILLVFDFITLTLLFYALRVKKLPYSYLMIYWWNPLLVKEIFNSGHLDVLVFPFVLGGLMLASRNQQIRSTLSIVVGIGLKLWPAFLLPVILRPLLSQPRRLAAGVLIIVIILGGLFVPLYMSGLDQSSGFIAYGERWQNNDSIFRGLILISEVTLDALGYQTFHKYAFARVLVASLIVLWIIFITFSNRYRDVDLYKKSLFIIAFVFLVSPTQFPWYYTWLLPLLVVAPRFSLLLPTLLLPLYYLRYYLEPMGRIELFTDVVVWIEFVPVWILILIEWRKSRVSSHSY
jgi:alpha-1,6-mannosyltransferase